jgi:hypothetical protein
MMMEVRGQGAKRQNKRKEGRTRSRATSRPLEPPITHRPRQTPTPTRRCSRGMEERLREGKSRFCVSRLYARPPVSAAETASASQPVQTWTQVRVKLWASVSPLIGVLIFPHRRRSSPMSSGVQNLRLRRPEPAKNTPPAPSKPSRHSGILQDQLRRSVSLRNFPSDPDDHNRAAKAPWSPSFSFALRMLLLVRVVGAMFSNIDDCDEGSERALYPLPSS